MACHATLDERDPRGGDTSLPFRAMVNPEDIGTLYYRVSYIKLKVKKSSVTLAGQETRRRKFARYKRESAVVGHNLRSSVTLGQRHNLV